MNATADEHRRPYLPGMGHDHLLPLYDPLSRLLGVTAMHRQLVDQAAVRPGQRLLEIGCGTGNLALLVARLHPGAEVTGIDPDPRALARARRKAARRGTPVRWDRGFAQELPYPDAAFDRVLSSLMLHHLDADGRVAALREARRVLRPGGTLHVLDLAGAAAPSRGLVARLAHRRPHLHGTFEERIPALLAEAGFVDPAEVGRRDHLFGPVAYHLAAAPMV
jgi:ubiquinone/menaquinone biosynthesis C-methylase UbiE